MMARKQRCDIAHAELYSREAGQERLTRHGMVLFVRGFALRRAIANRLITF